MLTVGMLLALAATAAASAAETKPASDARPNILLAISDDQSYPYASAYGCPGVKTPAFDRIARQGILFTNAICPSPGCAPSRASLLTGRYPWQNEHAGTHASSFPAKLVVYPDLLEKAGYFVGYTGKGWGPGDWEVGGRSRNPAGPEFNKIKIENTTPGVADCDYSANFRLFLEQRPKGMPFCFWYGGKEPHRGYAPGIGLRHGKKPEEARIPPFLPDTPEIRSDILDYCWEIEWFDRHLADMIAALEEAGEFDNTLIVVTSDNGMPFPRAKANVYEYGIHVPMALCWPRRIPGGRTVDDLISFVDLAPTFLDAAGVAPAGLPGGNGRSLMSILTSNEKGLVDTTREMVFSARERHSSSRYQNLGYPQRALRTQRYLYIRNFKPDRWPAGDPRQLNADGSLAPPDSGYCDIDPGPSLSWLITHKTQPQADRFFHLAVDKRAPEELYDIREDPGCLTNLISSAEHAQVLGRLRSQMDDYLRKTNDPRVTGNGDVFETYERYSPIRRFPPPDSSIAP